MFPAGLSPQHPHCSKYGSTRSQFIEWLAIIFYFSTPVILICTISVGADPFLFVVTHIVKFHPFLKRIWFPGYAKIFQLTALFFIVWPLIIWPLYNLVVYELFRITMFSLSLLVNGGGKMFSILHSLYKNRTCKRMIFLHKAYYSRLQIISQSVEPPLKISMAFIITALGMITCTSTLIVVRLHGKFQTGMTIVDACCAIFLLLLLDVILTLFGRCGDMCDKFLRGCKNSEVLGRMTGMERKLYLKEVDSLPRLVLAVGFGQFTLIRIRKGSKAKVLFYIVDRIVNVLAAFRWRWGYVHVYAPVHLHSYLLWIIKPGEN